MASRQNVTPILDIQSAEFAHQYQLGAYWARYGDEQGDGPQSDTYFIVNVTTLMQSGHVNDLRSTWFPNLGFFLGMVHGGLLSPETGKIWSHATTLVILSDPQCTRGYSAGRVWFFYEADPHERRLTDTYIMQRVHELTTESHAYLDEPGTINFALGCILGELSGQLFPMIQEEQERIQKEDRQVLAAYEARWGGTSQKRGAEPLRNAAL